MSLASSALMAECTCNFLKQLLPEIRIHAEIDVRIRDSGNSVRETMQCESAKADLVLLGLACPDEGKESEYAERLAELTEGLPSCFLIHNGSLFIGELVSPSADDGDDADEEQETPSPSEEPEGPPLKPSAVQLKADDKEADPLNKG